MTKYGDENNDFDGDSAGDSDILHLLVGFDLGVPEESHGGASAQSSISNLFLSEKIYHWNMLLMITVMMTTVFVVMMVM